MISGSVGKNNKFTLFKPYPNSQVYLLLKEKMRVENKQFKNLLFDKIKFDPKEKISS